MEHTPGPWTVDMEDSKDMGGMICAPIKDSDLKSTLQRLSDLADVLDKGDPYPTAEFLRITVDRYSATVRKATEPS